MNSPQFVEIVEPRRKATIEQSSPFWGAESDMDIAFNWLNVDYPAYHTHDHWELLIIVSGEICHNINGQKSVMGRGDACLIRPQDSHSLTFVKKNKGDYMHINFTFKDSFAQKILSICDCYDDLLNDSMPSSFKLDDSEIALLCDKTMLTQNLSKDKYEMNSKLIISRVLMNFFEKRLLYISDYPEWLNEFLTYITNPNTFGKTVKELAETTSYSYSRLACLFKEYTGETIVDYINRKKMVYAKRLLHTTEMTTLQISETIGYTSLSSFNHLFKDTYGMTPSQYRKKYR